MTYVRSSSATVLTSATGASTVYTADPLNGVLSAIKVVAAGTTSTADIVVTGNSSAIPILTKANITKSATSWFYPRALANTVAAAAASGISQELIPITNERIKTVMTGGGNAQSYTLTFYVV